MMDKACLFVTKRGIYHFSVIGAEYVNIRGHQSAYKKGI